MSFENAVKAILRTLRLREGKGRNDERWRTLCEEVRLVMDDNKINDAVLDYAGKDKLGAATKRLATIKSRVDQIIESDDQVFGPLGTRSPRWVIRYPERANLRDSYQWSRTDVDDWALKADDVAPPD